MKGRDGKSSAPTDLLVCFPSRAHLALMPKQICSPVRVTEASKRHNPHHHHLARVSNKGGQGSPLLWAKTKAIITNNMDSSEIDEPTSPKVTCAGQIKVKPKSGGNSCKNWQSVMEEIERIHKKNSSSSSSSSKNKHNKKSTWVEALGLKKDVTQFLACLRGFRVDFRCFGNFHGSDVISDDDDDEEEESEVGVNEVNDDHDENGSSSSSSRTAVYSKWFMVLEQENNNKNGLNNKLEDDEEKNDNTSVPPPPPPNALLLMRCRSAPAKSWLEEKQEEEEEKLKQQQQEKESKNNNHNLKILLLEEEEKEEEEEKKKNKENLIVKCYSPDFIKVSSDIAKETWVFGGVKDSRDPLSRSRSWKR